MSRKKPIKVVLIVLSAIVTAAIIFLGLRSVGDSVSPEKQIMSQLKDNPLASYTPAGTTLLSQSESTDPGDPNAADCAGCDLASANLARKFQVNAGNARSVVPRVIKYVEKQIPAVEVTGDTSAKSKETHYMLEGRLPNKENLRADVILEGTQNITIDLTLSEAP